VEDRGRSPVCLPEVVTNNGIVYAIGGGHTSLPSRPAQGRREQDDRAVWYVKGFQCRFADLHEGHLYWAGDDDGRPLPGRRHGKFVYSKRLDRLRADMASPVLADGKLYYVSKENGTMWWREAGVPAPVPQRHRGRQEPFECLDCRQRRTTVPAQRSVSVLHRQPVIVRKGVKPDPNLF